MEAEEILMTLRITLEEMRKANEGLTRLGGGIAERSLIRIDCYETILEILNNPDEYLEMIAEQVTE